MTTEAQDVLAKVQAGLAEAHQLVTTLLGAKTALTTPATPAPPAPVAWAQGTIENDALVVPILVGPPGGTTREAKFQHTKLPDIADSGAFTLLIDTGTAAALGLPNDGPATVTGIGGNVSSYWTRVDLEFPGNGYRANNEVAVVMPGFDLCLVGLMFAVNRKMVMCEDTEHAVLSYYRAADFWAPPGAGGGVG